MQITYKTDCHKLEKNYPTDSGYDIKAFVDDPYYLHPQTSCIVNTGIYLELPKFIEAQVRSRSGLAFNHRVVSLISPGTIDQSYRGEIKLLMINHGDDSICIFDGMRLAQLVFCEVPAISLYQVNEINKETERGILGFGSSGL